MRQFLGQHQVGGPVAAPLTACGQGQHADELSTAAQWACDDDRCRILKHSSVSGPSEGVMLVFLATLLVAPAPDPRIKTGGTRIF